MNLKYLTISGLIFLLASWIFTSCKTESTNSQNVEVTEMNEETVEDEIWAMEEKYWKYVEEGDTTSYKTLWHDDFIGYPSFGEGVSTKSRIAVWIPELHQDTSLTYRAKLYKRAVNSIEGVVVVFYDTDEMWLDNEGKIVRSQTYKFTHTWKKYNGNWVILGGMAARKDQDILKK